jgi:gamma-glutamyltranspeptidase/glutathione hydrolase
LRYPRVCISLLEADPVIRRSPDMAKYFLNADGSVKAVGTRLQNPALAAVLKRIANEGPDALYKGPIAEEIVAKVQGHANPGSLSLNDLQRYQAKERAPLCTDYKRWQVCGMPPPSSGGIAVAQILGTLQALETRDPRLSLTPLKPVKTDKPAGIEPNPQAVHLIAEAERLAYADRAQYVADTDFVPVPVKGLVDPGLSGQPRQPDRRTQHGQRQTGHTAGCAGGLRAGPFAAAHLHLASGRGG